MNKPAHSQDHRICFIGDSFVQGTCDPECRGWVGRVAAAARAGGFDVTAYNLGVRRDTSRDILRRWEQECMARFNFPSSKYIVFSFGANDMKEEEQGLRVPTMESVANFSAVLSKAKSLCEVRVVGPVPVGDTEQNQRIQQLCQAYAQEAARLEIPYLPVARQLMEESPWLEEVRKHDGSHPGAQGYGALAGLVQSWPAWWFTSMRG